MVENPFTWFHGKAVQAVQVSKRYKDDKAILSPKEWRKHLMHCFSDDLAMI